MEGTILSKEDKKMLFEMASHYFPGEFQNFIKETQMFTSTIIYGLVQDSQIHWFEFVVKHLGPKILIDNDGDTLFNYYYDDPERSLIKHLYTCFIKQKDANKI